MDRMEIRDASPRDCDRGAYTFLQTGFWGAFKAFFGWKSRHFLVGAEARPLLVLERALAPGFSFAYVPRGSEPPETEGGRVSFLESLASSLKDRLPSSCVFLRFDPPWYSVRALEEDYDSSVRPVPSRPFRRAAADVQPPDTVVLSLSGRSDEDLLSRMKPKWRYNIRLSEKKGVRVSSESGPEALDAFYSLYQATAARDRIALHPKRYYEGLVELSGKYGPDAPELRVWMARLEGRPLAAIITSFFRSEAVYLYGASSDENRSFMPAYALQWAAIRAARDAGCSEYDFYGIPPREDPGHPMAGLYRFKTGFGGEIRHYAGSWDYPLRPALYGGYRAAEALRAFWFKNVRKRIAGGSR